MQPEQTYPYGTVWSDGMSLMKLLAIVAGVSNDFQLASQPAHY